MKKLIYFGIAALFLLYSCKDEPQASFEASSTSIAPGESVEFTNNSTESVRYEWKFGDGSSSDEINPIHTYTKSGTYTVTLTAYSKKDKASSEATAEIKVTETNEEQFMNTWNYDQKVVTNHDSSGATNTVTYTYFDTKLDFQADNHYVFNDSAGSKEAGNWYLLSDDELKLEGGLYDNNLPEYFNITTWNNSTLELNKRQHRADTSGYTEWTLTFSK